MSSCDRSPWLVLGGGCAVALALSACTASRPSSAATAVVPVPSAAVAQPAPHRSAPGQPYSGTTAGQQVPAVPPISAVPTLQRDHLIALALATNPELASLHAAIDRIQAQARQVAAFPDPRLGYRIAPQTVNHDQLVDGHVVNLSQRVPWAGKRGAAEAALLAEAGAGAAEVTVAQQRLAGRLSADYYGWWGTVRSAHWVTTHRQRVQELAQLAERRQATGGGSLTDVIQARQALAGLDHRLVVLEQRGAVFQATLNAALHRPITATFPPLPTTALSELLPEPPPVTDRITQAWSARPELGVLAQRRQAVEQRLRLARLSGMPDVTLEAGYNSLWQNDDQRLTLGFSLDLPLQRGRITGAVAEQEAALRHLDAAILNRRDQIAAEVAAAQAAVIESRHVLALFAQQHLPLAQERLQAAQAAYLTGRDPFDFLIAAERHLLDTELAQIEALALAATRWIAWQLASGHSPHALSEPLGLGSGAEPPPHAVPPTPTDNSQPDDVPAQLPNEQESQP